MARPPLANVILTFARVSPGQADSLPIILRDEASVARELTALAIGVAPGVKADLHLREGLSGQRRLRSIVEAAARGGRLHLAYERIESSCVDGALYHYRVFRFDAPHSTSPPLSEPADKRGVLPYRLPAEERFEAVRGEALRLSPQVRTRAQESVR